MIVMSAVACGSDTAQPSATTTRAASFPRSNPTAAVSGGPGAAGAAAVVPGGEVAANSASGANPAGGLLPPPAPAAAAGDGACNQDVDVVFSLDVSGSMTPSLMKLVAEVGAVDAALKTKNLPGPPHYGLVIFVDDLMLMNSGEPYADVEALKAEVMSQANLTSGDTARQVGPADDNLSWPENSLDALYAATQFKWRPLGKTLRIIFHITDASFWDGPDPSSGADIERPFGQMPTSMHRYMDTIGALRMQQIWVVTFACKTGGPPDGMMAPASHGQFRGISVDVGKGFFEPYMGQKSIPDATGGTAWDLDDVYDGKISLGDPIRMSIESRQCVVYPLN
jgi:hypothetical protein